MCALCAFDIFLNKNITQVRRCHPCLRTRPGILESSCRHPARWVGRAHVSLWKMKNDQSECLAQSGKSAAPADAALLLMWEGDVEHRRGHHQLLVAIFSSSPEPGHLWMPTGWDVHSVNAGKQSSASWIGRHQLGACHICRRRVITKCTLKKWVNLSYKLKRIF